MAPWKQMRWMIRGLAMAALFLGGCGMQLETGYQYRPLNASAVQRRAYYASPFTQEKAAAQQEKQGDKGPALGPTAQ
jgi:hypothetical protein